MNGELVLMTAIGGHEVAIPAIDVQSVIELEDLTPVPGAPDYIAGLAALRSQALTVIDCRIALGLEATERRILPGMTGEQAIVVEVDDHLYALIVDLANDVTMCTSDAKPVAGEMSGKWTNVAHGMVETAQGTSLLVDPAAFIRGQATMAA